MQWLFRAMHAQTALWTLGALPPKNPLARAVVMHVVHHAHLPHTTHEGESSIAAVDRSRGIRDFEVSVRTLEPGVHTAAQQHVGELVVLALAGNGKLVVDGGPQRFSGPCTLVIPPRTAFELVNTSNAPLQLVWVFTVAPTPVVA